MTYLYEKHRLVAAAVLILAACGPASSDSEADVVGYARPAVLVDTEWVVAHLNDPSVHLVDVSTRRDVYDAGHLPGASHVRWDADLTDPTNPVPGMVLSADSLSALMGRLGVENDHTVVLYDDSRNLFAARAYWALRYYQHPDVRIYNGGSRKWVADGHALVADTVARPPSSYVAGAPDPSIATDWNQVVAALGDSNTMLCDARTPEEYAGTDVRAERGGRIPGAVNVVWTDAVQDDGTFHDAATLRELYGNAGFTPNRTIVTYCQSGVRGAHTWFVLSELLGYPDVRNYDGSWAEYGNRADSPIE